MIEGANLLFDAKANPVCFDLNARPRVKICGLREKETAEVAVEVGADAIGLMFYEPSPRYVTPEVAESIITQVKGRISIVGVFVNPIAAGMEAILARVSLDVLQFHGEEKDAFCRQWGLPYIKALRLREGGAYESVGSDWPGAAAFLVDSYTPDAYGGTGALCDWDRIPKALDRPVILAGGLCPNNIGAAIARVKPWCVDVSSGVECRKGVKDAVLIRAFMREVNNVSER
jgi:phosphoribosylanthranilate isomerase